MKIYWEYSENAVQTLNSGRCAQMKTRILYIGSYIYIVFISITIVVYNTVPQCASYIPYTGFNEYGYNGKGENCVPCVCAMCYAYATPILQWKRIRVGILNALITDQYGTVPLAMASSLFFPFYSYYIP